MEIETSPPQPDEVARAIAETIAVPRPDPDPWWEAGLQEALGE